MATMRDVARLSGVSVATVSAALNGSAKVSARLTKRVQKAVEALEYHPDQNARSLKVGKTNVIGMIIPDITNTFFPEVIHGVESAARKAGYSVILCNSNEDPAQERDLLSALIARRVDGVLLASPDASGAYAFLSRRRLPIVFVDRVPQGSGFPAVCTDNLRGAYDGVRHLISLGHERIAIICGPSHLSPFLERLEGFRQAMQEGHLAVRDEYLRQGGLEIQGGCEAMLGLLRLDEPPTAVFACNNKIVLGVTRAISERSILCPEQLSVVGFDAFAGAEYFKPKLTTVAQPTCELGRRAMELLVAEMQGSTRDLSTAQSMTMRLKAELRVRDSTAPPRGFRRRTTTANQFRDVSTASL